jgi:two-component system response regulator (stage 0 sporulation protein F)
MPAKKRHSILVVEDDVTLNEAYALILKQAGYDVKVAFTGKEALSIIAEEDPDMIILDLRMPVMDGVEFLKRYRPRTKHPQVSIIVFSNYDMPEEIEQVYELGAERYVLKAWASPGELLKIVDDTLTTHKH